METIAQAVSPRGELVLRRRRRDDGEPIVELRVNGVYVMDSAETSAERRLATEALSLAESPATAFVGGLGLGFTLAAVLADPRVQRVVVAEMEQVVAEWIRAGHVASTAHVLSDPRVDLQLDDVRRVLAEQPAGSVDAVLLDVDNGPNALVFDHNAGVYTGEFLRTCAERLRTGGVLAVWSAEPSGNLRDLMAVACSTCRHVPIPVYLQGRETAYHLYLGQRS